MTSYIFSLYAIIMKCVCSLNFNFYKQKGLSQSFLVVISTKIVNKKEYLVSFEVLSSN